MGGMCEGRNGVAEFLGEADGLLLRGSGGEEWARARPRGGRILAKLCGLNRPDGDGGRLLIAEMAEVLREAIARGDGLRLRGSGGEEWARARPRGGVYWQSFAVLTGRMGMAGVC